MAEYRINGQKLVCVTRPDQRPCKQAMCARPECEAARRSGDVFNVAELEAIRAMCRRECPRFPDVPMFEPWRGLYRKASKLLGE